MLIPSSTLRPVIALPQEFALLLLAALVIGLVVVGFFLRSYLYPPTEQKATAQRQGVRFWRPTARSARSSGKSAALSKQAEVALERGDRGAAYHYYSQAVELCSENELAWLGKAKTARSPAEKRLCLMRLLTINPGSLEAQIELDNLDRGRKRARR